MNALSLPTGSWTVVATVEVAANEAITQFLPRETADYRFEPAPSSPQGFAWIDIYVDFSAGIEHAARIARSVLEELGACGFSDFRIIAGGSYLELTSTAFA